ncbi:YMD3 protein, partial [Pseudoatta argentina]
MKFVLQPLSIRVTNCDAKSRIMGGSVEKGKHGEMLPSTIRAIICGTSNCDKTNVLISLLESLNSVRFENVYVYLKSLQQPKYRYLENLFTSIDEISYFTFNNSDIVPPSKACLNSIFIIDDVACDKQDVKKIEKISSERRRLIEELHTPARRNFPQRRIIVRGYDDLWQADVVQMSPYSGFNRGHHYILIVIDVLGKYAWAVLLKSKGGSETANAITEIVRENRCPKNLQTDMGIEFYNADVQKILKKHDVNHYSTYSTLKASYELHRATHPDVYLVEKVVPPAIRGGEDRATRGCKIAIGATFRARWCRVCEWRVRDEISLIWQEIDAAFESRISTGAVINSNHIEPRRFLEDAKEIVFERVRDAVERHVVRAACHRAYSSIARRVPGTYDRESSYPYYTTVLNLANIEFKNLSRLVSSQISEKKNQNFSAIVIIFCFFFRCLHYFSTNEKLQSYVMDCEKINDSAIRLPSVDDKWLEFGNYCNKDRVPFIVYADLE